MSSGSDLETSIAQKVAEKKPKERKKKSKPKPVVAAPSGHGKNEGSDPHWAYAPPAGAERLDHAVDAGAFDWDALKDDDDVEMWLIKVPDTIKPKHLDGLEIDPPSSRTARVGSLARKTASYDVWSVVPDDDDDDDDAPGCAAAEGLLGLSCLLPRKRKKGRLYVAPKRVVRHIVVSARPATATAPDHPVVYQNPPRPSYPKEVLKHAFVPYGARSAPTRSEDMVMEVDVEIPRENSVSDAAPPPKEKHTKKKEAKGKKRKGEGDLPKKSKKHKSDV